MTTMFSLINLIKGLSFKLNNANFTPLSFRTFSKSCSFVSMSLPSATAFNSLSNNVSLSSNHLPNSTNELFPMVVGVLHGAFFPN